MSPLTLESPLTDCHGIGEQTALKCQEAGLRRLKDLLFFLPLRYEDRTRLTPLAHIQPCDGVLVQGVVVSNRVVYARRRTWQLEILDNGVKLSCRFFYFSSDQQRKVKIGDIFRCYGAVRATKTGFEMVHPDYRVLDPLNPQSLEATLTPVYPTIEGFTNKRVVNLVHQALRALSESAVVDYLHAWLNDHPTLVAALKCLHQPPPELSLQSLVDREHPALERLVIEELVTHQLMFRLQKKQWQKDPSIPLNQSSCTLESFLPLLPFIPTNAQLRAMNEVFRDLQQPFAMNRLLQGDVGSGKTAVAAFTAYMAYQNGYQVALMAPTELLAQQHWITLSAWFKDFGDKIILLTGSTKSKAYLHVVDRLSSGEALIVIGTHALFQSRVEFPRLGAVIIDEQHRFGVDQRKQLMNKTGQNYQAHQLIMTATPIPRTLAMSLYADLDTSVLDELPPNRTAVQTIVVPNEKRREIIERIKHILKEGRQAYWVCPLVEESEVLTASAAQITFEMLQECLKGLKVGLVHGKLSAQEKERIMQSFRANDIQLLVSTTVIEVGVDVPNATLMIIENAERFGLAQLHQLRGRVGRGAALSHCVLLYEGPLSQTAQARLQIMRQSQDGFLIADKDLELRGPGEVLGTRQKGAVRYRIVDLKEDAHLISKARNIAINLETQAPEAVSALMDRWFADNQVYRNV